jgi:CrcB protein
MVVIYAAIAVGGAIGAMARYAVATGCGWLFGAGFPYGTFIINITGSFFLGWFSTVAVSRGQMSDATRLAIATGFVGAYTTFSTYMFESQALFRDGATAKALVNVIGSVIVGLAAVWVGVRVGAR